MKAQNIMIYGILLLFNCNIGYGQCQNSTQFPLAPISVGTYNTPKTIAANNYAGDFAVVTQLENGKSYSFSSSNPSDYITIRTADHNIVLAHGNAPVSYTSLQSDFTITMHINTNASCGTEIMSRATTVTCTNCDPEPGKTGINTTTPEAILDVNGEIRIGKTDLSPKEGMIRYDSSTKRIEARTNGSWKNLVGDVSPTNELQVLSKSGDTLFLSNSNYVTLDFNEPDPFLNSAIITATEGQRINEWIGNNNQKWERCYQKTVDGATSTIFHNNCDYKGESVVIIKLDNGRKFGGYAGLAWKSRNGFSQTNSSFLFSIDNDKKYMLGYYPESSMYDHSSYGPTFGNGHDIYVNSSMNIQYINFPYAFSYNGNGGPSAPSNAAAQELAGIDLVTTATIMELEVWIKVY